MRLKLEATLHELLDLETTPLSAADRARSSRMS